MLNLDRDVLACGAGAGIGVVIPEVLSKYIEPQYGATIPGVDTILPLPWSRWSVFVPLVTGIPALLAGMFYRSNYSGFLFGYGVASTANGALRGVFNMPTARARSQMRPRQVRPVARIRSQQAITGSRPLGKGAPRLQNGLTETGISSKIIWA